MLISTPPWECRVIQPPAPRPDGEWRETSNPVSRREAPTPSRGSPPSAADRLSRRFSLLGRCGADGSRGNASRIDAGRRFLPKKGGPAGARVLWESERTSPASCYDANSSQQRLRFLQIARVKPLRQSPVNRSQQFARFARLALVAPTSPVCCAHSCSARRSRNLPQIGSGLRRVLPHLLHDLDHALPRARNRPEVIVEYAQLFADGTTPLDRNPGRDRQVDVAQLADPAHELCLEHGEIQCDGFEGE